MNAVVGCAGWIAVEGDFVSRLLAVVPVKVEGFADPHPVLPPAAAPEPTKTLTAWVRRDDDGSTREYVLGKPLNPVANGHVPTNGGAWLGVDGKVYTTSLIGAARTRIGSFVPGLAARLEPKKAFVKLDDDGSTREYVVGDVLAGIPTCGRAFLSGDGKIYSYSCPAARTSIGHFVPRPLSTHVAVTERWGIFCENGERSESYPRAFPSKEAAERYLDQEVSAARRRINRYFVRKL